MSGGGGGGGGATLPGSSTDNAIVRWDGTGGDTLQDSGITISDAGVLLVTDGAEATPSVAFSGDPNTGPWGPAADTYAISTGGTEAIRWNSSQQTLTVDGTVGAPAWSFADDTAMGVFRAGTNTMRFSIAGTYKLSMTASQALFNQAFTTTTPFLALASDPNSGLASFSSDEFGILTGGVEAIRWSASQQTITKSLVVTPDANTSGVEADISYTAPAHTGLTASNEVPGVLFDMSATKTWATGAISSQHAFRILAPTYAFDAASTITDAATVYINSAPVAGANATIDAAMALWVAGGRSRFDGGLTAGDPGTEILGIDLAGANFTSSATISDISGANAAQFIIHRHSTTLGPVMVASRSHSNTSAHSVVLDNDTLFDLYAVGWDGADYAIGGRMYFAVDGAPSAGDMPTEFVIQLSADGTEVPASVLTLSPNAHATFSGTVELPVGTAVDPSVHFTGSLSTGIYSDSANRIAFTCNTQRRLVLDATGHMIIIGGGTEAAPAYVVTGSTTGPWWPSTTDYAISVGGTEAVRWDTSLNQTNAGTIHTIDGSPTAPAYGFNSTGTGLYANDSATVRISLANSYRYGFATTAFLLNLGSSTTVPRIAWAADTDTGIGRPTTGMVGMICQGVQRQTWGPGTTTNPISEITRDNVLSEAPSDDLDVVALNLSNSTAATSLLPQNSPAIMWEGQYFSTDAASTRTALWAAYVVTSTTASEGADVSVWTLDAASNGTWATMLTIESDGDGNDFTFNGRLVPNTDELHDLGTSTVSWDTLYILHVFAENATSRLRLGAPVTTGVATIEQTNSTGALPTIALTQDDVSEEFIRFTGQAANANLTQSIVAEADVTTATRAGFVKVNVQDEGNQITDGDYFMPIFTLA